MHIPGICTVVSPRLARPITVPWSWLIRVARNGRSVSKSSAAGWQARPWVPGYGRFGFRLDQLRAEQSWLSRTATKEQSVSKPPCNR